MMKDPTEFKQRFKRWQEGEKVYEAGKILPEVVVTADDPIKKLVEDVNARSNADFVNRVKDPNRTWIQDWEHDGHVATHKLSWAEDGGKAIVFPNVQNINGELHDFTDPKYNHGKWDALDSAIERGDTLLMTPKQAKMYTENYKKYYPKGKTFDCGKSLPKYDYGTDDNPWIPKGTKVPTENSQEVRVSALPKTTTVSKLVQAIDDNLTEQQRGLAYLRHLYNIDKPLNGEDPIGELAVEGAALGPVFKGLSWVGKQVVKQAMPYIGRALKPVTNLFAAKALSNSIDDAVATPTFSKVLPATELIWQDLNLPHRSYKSGSMRGPFTEEVFRRNGIFDAFDAFDNPARKQLVDRLSEEAGFPLLISTGRGKFPGTIKILMDSDADKILGKNVLGRRDGYTLYARESADPTTVFHEALHLQGFGNVDWDWPKLLSLLDDYLKKDLRLALLESSSAPFMLIRDAKRDYYAAEQAYKQLFELKTATELFLKLKVESVLRDDAEEYIRQPHEFVVHGLQAGRKVGLKPYQPEPMYDPYNTGVPIVDFGKIMETVNSAIKKHDWMADLKLDTPLDYHNAWKVLTGNFLPAAVITGGTFGALQEHDKGKSIKPLPKYDGGTDDKTYLPEYEYEATVTPQGTSLEKHKRITNEEDWLKYWGDVGAGYVNLAQESAAPVVLNGMSMLTGNPLGALAGIVGSEVGSELGAKISPRASAIGGLAGGFLGGVDITAYNRALPYLYNEYKTYKLTNAINRAVKENPIITGYNRNPALKDVGDLWDYQNYLKQVYPNTLIKDAVWHGSRIKDLQKFSTEAIGSNAPIKGSVGMYLTPYKFVADSYGKRGGVYPVLLNSENPYITRQNFALTRNGVNVARISPNVKNTVLANNDAVVAPQRGEIAFFNPNNALILGSKSDMLAFSKFARENKPNFDPNELFLKPVNNQYDKIISDKDLVDAWNRIYNTFLYDKGKYIHINPANKGKFNATKKRTGKTTEQLAHSKNPLTRKRAVFALNSRKFKH